MNYILSESQFNVLSHVHAQLQLLANINAQVKDKEVHVRAHGFIGTIHLLESQLLQTLTAISDTE